MAKDRRSLNGYCSNPVIREVSEYFISGKGFIPFILRNIDFNLSCKIASWDISSAFIAIDYLQNMFSKHDKLIHPIYVDGQNSEAVLIHLPSDDPDSSKPPVIMCAGGGFLFVSAITSSFPVAEVFNKAGYDVWVINYRFDGFKMISKPIQDLAGGIRLMRELTGKDDYMAVGFSAGGYLVSLFGTENNQLSHSYFSIPAPKAQVLLFPITNLNDLGHGLTSLVEKLKIVGFMAPKTQIKARSVVDNINSAYPPSFIVACKDDRIVPFTNSTLLKERLDEASVKSSILLGEHGGHGFALGTRTDVPTWTAQALAFLKSID